MKQVKLSLPRGQNGEISARGPASPEALKKIVRTMNLKVTHQRLAILEVLHSGRRHTTAQEVFEAVNGNFPEIGFATVYRFLKALTDHAFVTEVRMGGLPARYELNDHRHHHDHMTCNRCGKIFEFENEEIERLQEKVATQLGFQLTGHVLELYGICEKCKVPKNH